MRKLWCAIGLGVVLMAGCKPGTPKQYIQPDEIEDILVDYHLARGLAVYDPDPDYKQALYVKAVLQKHGITQEELDSSLVYYYKRADRFIDIYKRVADRLEEKALLLGATEGEIGTYAALNAEGDTANIWAHRTMAALMPTPPFNRWEFEIEADSTYRRGDSFLLQFMSDFTYQQGSKNGVVYVVTDYPDTTIAHSIHFSTSGVSQLRINGYDKSDIRSMRGYFYLGDGGEVSSTVRLLFLSNIQLIRFHHQQENEEQLPADSLTRDSIRGRLQVDTVGGGALERRGDTLVSVDRRITPDRVVEPDRQPATR